MIKLLNDVFNMTYSLGHNINEIVLGLELYKVFALEVADRLRYEVADPKAEYICYKNIKVTCDYNNPILIQVK